MEFDIQSLGFKINQNLTSSDFIFNINGTVHGQQVFTDGIYYMFKGGKLMNCALA